jgi:hypothetical protein
MGPEERERGPARAKGLGGLMWIMLNDCFLSIVSKDCARDELLVRARRKGDIEKIFPEARVVRDVRTDYLFRAVVKRDVVKDALAGEVARITYPNFKGSIAAEERELHDAYLRVWSTMANLQKPRPYSGGSKFSGGLYDDPFPAPAGSAGGKGRASKLTAERRSQIARDAANARWRKAADERWESIENDYQTIKESKR